MSAIFKIHEILRQTVYNQIQELGNTEDYLKTRRPI